jgi:hypothetical protein
MNLVRYGDKSYPYYGRLFDVAGIKGYIGRWPMPHSKYRVIKIADNLFLNFNQRALPSLRVVQGASYFTNRPDSLEATARVNAPVEDEVFLEKDFPASKAVLFPCSRPLRLVSGPVSLGGSRLSPQWACWIGKMKGGSHVVFNETFFPGWKAWVDGKPTRIDRSYGQFMSVRVDQSFANRVDFRYEPESFRLGLFLSLVSFVFWGYALLFWMAKHKGLKVSIVSAGCVGKPLESNI